MIFVGEPDSSPAIVFLFFTFKTMGEVYVVKITHRFGMRKNRQDQKNDRRKRCRFVRSLSVRQHLDDPSNRSACARYLRRCPADRTGRGRNTGYSFLLLHCRNGRGYFLRFPAYRRTLCTGQLRSVLLRISVFARKGHTLFRQHQSSRFLPFRTECNQISPADPSK